MDRHRVIGRDRATALLLVGQLAVYQGKKEELQANIDVVRAYPEGRIVYVFGGTMSQTDWLAWAATEMASIDEHIAELIAQTGT